MQRHDKREVFSYGYDPGDGQIRKYRFVNLETGMRLQIFKPTDSADIA